ncbi:hypothetical protein [Calothrix sp. UHCC 0171]|uniref:hypothetical protein n=1 Tax=Calothrix sp. UHCC 0171 TaxID=3110245 RepID=UPI002B20D43C|nr:hypothetical protein [Calothrix sp. UHCC 0171]MEA5570084.1 hypothetical protein [Calothrix sp. UHCC 0171]
MLLSAREAGKIALDFLMEEWSISTDEKDWFVVLSSRMLGPYWYVVEIGVEGLPDKWFIQVYDTGECDPNYTFSSPIRGLERYMDLKEMPSIIAEIVVSERNSR